MLAELFEYCTTPAESWARRLGYLTEAIAIKARHRRCRFARTNHLTQSRTAISSLIDKIGGGRIAVILGAGSCLDIPLGELADRFDEVWLVDAAHLRSRKISQLKNAIRVTRDLTGIAEEVMRSPKRLPDPPSLDWLMDNDAIDFVVSANIASQLSVIPLAYMRKFTEIDEDSGDFFHRALIRQHFDWLSRLDCSTLILCDAVRRVTDSAGELVEESALLGDLAPGKPVKSWRWPVVPQGEGRGGRMVENEVHLYCDRLTA